ncbi:MAG: MucB/RseB C-terminal domain-containing protein, partial [Burkholderiales bacterium]
MRGLALLLAIGCGFAQAQSSPEALALLNKIHQATQRLSYTGTFVYQQGNRTEISRIARIADASGGTEKLEVLDGVPREVVRTREGVRCYLPASQTVKVERVGAHRDFPAILPDRLGDLPRHYVASRGESARIAGFDCISVMLTPRDDLRYGYVLWADANTGMLLRARTINEKGETIEQFTFTQLLIGPVARDKVKPRHAARNWRIEDGAAAPADLSEAGWTINADLPGFRKIDEVRRKLRESLLVGQVVYSDGLAAVSVFIEPLAERRELTRTGLSNLGAINIYTREVANHLVTVVGETPAASVRRIA